MLIRNSYFLEQYYKFKLEFIKMILKTHLFLMLQIISLE